MRLAVAALIVGVLCVIAAMALLVWAILTVFGSALGLALIGVFFLIMLLS